MAIVTTKQAAADTARLAWSKANGGLEPMNAQYVIVEFQPDGGAICELKGNDGRYLAHVWLSAAEVAAIGKQV